MVTNGYLLMFGPEHAEEQYKALENHKACEAGTKNIKGSELSNIFPYINSDGIETATYTDNQILLYFLFQPHMLYDFLKLYIAPQHVLDQTLIDNHWLPYLLLDWDFFCL